MAPPTWLRELTHWARRRPGPALGSAVLLALVLLWALQPAPSPSRLPSSSASATVPPALPRDALLERALATVQQDTAALTDKLNRQAQELANLQTQQRAAQEQQRRLQHEQRQFLATAVQEQRQQLDTALQSIPRSSGAPPAAPIVARTAVTAPPVPPPRLRLLQPDGQGTESSPAAAGKTLLPDNALPAAASSPSASSPPAAYLPAGSFVRGQLLTGVFASTQSGGALPALFAIQEGFSGPNRSRIPLRGCLALGKAAANLTALRALVQLTMLSCVLADGTTFEQPIQGYVTGRDGTLGIPGRLEQREGAFLAKTFLVSLVHGAAAAFARAETVTQVTPLGGSQTAVTGDTGRFAAFQALSSGSARLADFYLQQVEQLLPLVWVASGTPVYLVLQEGVVLQGLPQVARPVTGLD